MATKDSSPFESGRCRLSASGTDAVIQMLHLSDVVRLTSMAFGWTGLTIAFGSHVRNENKSCSPSAATGFLPRTPVHGLHNPANANKGRSSPSANQCGTAGFLAAYSQNAETGTKQRFSGFI